MGTTDKKYKFLIEYENFDIARNRRPTEYPVTHDEDNTKLKCTLEQAIQYAKDKIDGERYTQALIMSYDPHDCSYNSGIASVSTIPPYIEHKANKLHLDLRKQENFYKLKEKYNSIYNFINEPFDIVSIKQLDEFIDNMKFDGVNTTVDVDNTSFFVCKRKFTSYRYETRLQLVRNLQKRIMEATNVRSYKDFEPRVYKYKYWLSCLFDYDETDPLHCDNDEIEL